jgi:hypothetical protein
MKKRGLITSLNSRLFMVKRLIHLNHNALLKVVDGLCTSKLRYGLQLYGQVRRNDEDPMNAHLAAIQKVQHKLERILNRCKISDKISTKILLDRENML